MKAKLPLAVQDPVSSAGVPFDNFRQATLYASAFYLKRTLLLLVPLLLHFMHMLLCFLLLALSLPFLPPLSPIVRLPFAPG